MTEEDNLLREAISKIAGQERQILDDFAKANIAAKSFLTHEDIAYIITHLQLYQQEVREGNFFGYKYWYSWREND